MNIFKYVQRQLSRLRIDVLTQGAFLAGDVPSIDSTQILKTGNSNYEELEIIFFELLKIKPGDVFVDVGCGKGRVFSYFIYKGLKNKMLGYEINESVAIKAKKRLARYNNIEIITENIFNDFPKDGNIFYLYNPFKEAMMNQFMDEILKIADNDPIIVYNTPIWIKLFDNDHFTYQMYDLPVEKYSYNFQFAIIRLKK